MDKTMEIILVAMVLMVSAVIVISMANSQIGGFGSTMDDQRGEVSDDLDRELGEVDDTVDETSYESGSIESQTVNPSSSLSV